MPLAKVTDGVQAYRITLSPKGDIAEEAEKKFVKWISRTCDMAYIVAEHGVSGKRHVHALVLYDSKRQKSVIQNYIWQNQVKAWHPESIQKIAVVVTAAFDFNWRDEYLQKEEDAEVLFHKWDDEHAVKYLPTQDEQEALVEAKGDAKMGRAMHDHKMWSDMAGHFKVWYIKEGYPVGTLAGEKSFQFVQPHHCLEFLNLEMLHGRMVAMLDGRRRQEKAIWLYRVVTGDAKPSDGERQQLDRWRDGHMVGSI